jgi:O-antigen/teichoic acid export membrane protein
MYSKPWMIVTVVLCLVFAALAFPVFLKAKGLSIAVVYTLIGFAVIWFAYFARAWVFTRPGFGDGKDKGKGSG